MVNMDHMLLFYGNYATLCQLYHNLIFLVDVFLQKNQLPTRDIKWKCVCNDS